MPSSDWQTFAQEAPAQSALLTLGATLAWRIEFADEARKELLRLDPPVARRIHAFLAERLAPLDDPRSIGEALRGPKLGTYWKYRVGDWRVIATIEDGSLCILVLRIGNRREVYR